MQLITSTFTFSDGFVIPYYEMDSQDRKNTKTVILGIHGLLSDLDYWQSLAANLSVLAPVDIHLPILRGYTNEESKKGDIPNFGQYDYDIEEILYELEYEYDHIIVIGHSAGAANLGRLLSRKRLSEKIAKIVFASPFLHPVLPVNRDSSSAEDKSSNWEVYAKRAKLYHLLYRVNPLFHGRPSVIKVPMREVPYDPASEIFPYELSYRLVMSRFIDLKTTDWPLLAASVVFIGSKDEVIDPEKLKLLWEEKTGREIKAVDDEDHNSILTSPALLQDVIETVRSL